jgi:hypothetical protein
MRLRVRPALLVYDPKAFLLCHPRGRLDQACAHCPKFLTAALGCATRLDSAVAVRSHKPAWDTGHGSAVTESIYLIPGGRDLRWPLPFHSRTPAGEGGVRMGGGTVRAFIGYLDASPAGGLPAPPLLTCTPPPAVGGGWGLPPTRPCPAGGSD